MKAKAYKGNESHRFDVKAVRELLLGESKYISEMWDNFKLPVSVNNDEDYLKSSSKNSEVDEKRSKEFISLQNKGSSRAKSLEELQEKLQAFRGKKLGYKDKLLKKGLKNRALKRQKKDKHKMRKRIKTETDFTSNNDVRPKSHKPIYNSEGKMVFSKFDFSESGVKTKPSGKKEKDPHKILEKIEKQNEKIKDMVKEGELQKASELKEKLAWNRALDKAEGIKVKDNPELLKKTIKKEMKKKERSKKKWESRIEAMQNRQEEQQKKRTENIQARKKQVKVNKMKKAVKKGRIIPGF